MMVSWLANHIHGLDSVSSSSMFIRARQRKEQIKRWHCGTKGFGRVLGPALWPLPTLPGAELEASPMGPRKYPNLGYVGFLCEES